MLRKLRIVLAVSCFAGVCLLFCDVSGILPVKLAFLGKVQLVPALLSGNFAVVAGLAVLTLLFGRVYCSTLCPLGVMQDLLVRLGKRRRYSYSKNKVWLRAAALLLFTLAFFAGAQLLFSMLEPYSAFGRIAGSLLAPAWQSGSNTLAALAERAGSFAVGPTPLWQKGMAALAAAVLTLGVIGALALRSGRTWCNTLCPVGAFLGLLSRFSLFRPRIDAAACVRCGLCAKSCKASCLDSVSASVDSSRCVACYNCLEACNRQAISYTPSWKAGNAEERGGNPDLARRALVLAGLAALGAPSVASAARAPGGKPLDFSRKAPPSRDVPITPPGSSGLRAFTERCTGCQLCVSACPHQVLRSFDQGRGMLQPSLSFEHGYCRVNCVVCSEVCPTGAIRPINAAEKSATQIGRAVADASRCIVSAEKEECTACSRACPTGAAALVSRNGGTKWLAVDPERCTGCGACEYVCPVRPLAAIRVEANLEHRRV